MKISIVEIGEPLPLEENVRLLRYGNFCRYLASKGHEVTWWTSSFSHMPKKHLVDSTQKITINGHNFWILYGGGYTSNVSLARIHHNRVFARKYSVMARQEEKPDIIISPLPTIENAMASLEMAQEWKIPILTDIRDEWPDEIVNLLPWLLRPLGRLALAGSFINMKAFCRQVDGIMAISLRQLNYGLSFAGRPQNKSDHVFPLGYPIVEVEKTQLENAQKELQEAFNPGRFQLNVCFFGTLGRYFEFDSLAQAARQLPDVGFIVAGDGDKREALTKHLKQLNNVYLPGWVNTPEITAISDVCDVGLAPYVGSASFAMPNKIYEYLSHGLAIGATIGGDFKNYLDDYNFGFQFGERDGESLISHLRYLKNSPDDLLLLQKNARELFDKKFCHTRVFEAAEEHIIRCCSEANRSKRRQKLD